MISEPIQPKNPICVKCRIQTASTCCNTGNDIRHNIGKFDRNPITITKVTIGQKYLFLFFSSLHPKTLPYRYPIKVNDLTY